MASKIKRENTRNENKIFYYKKILLAGIFVLFAMSVLLKYYQNTDEVYNNDYITDPDMD